jgi:hypothetical protein
MHLVYLRPVVDSCEYYNEPWNSLKSEISLFFLNVFHALCPCVGTGKDKAVR